MLRTAAQASTQLQSTISLFLSRRPKHPHFASEQCRVESFTFTGAQIPRGQSVEILAKAGFFYEGPGDKVRCYYCDGGLKNWNPIDEPWAEHKRWFASCLHLLDSSSMVSLRSVLPLSLLMLMTSSAVSIGVGDRCTGGGGENATLSSSSLSDINIGALK